jgi:hypothetical protein
MTVDAQDVRSGCNRMWLLPRVSFALHPSSGDFDFQKCVTGRTRAVIPNFVGEPPRPGLFEHCRIKVQRDQNFKRSRILMLFRHCTEAGGLLMQFKTGVLEKSLQQQQLLGISVVS